MKLATPKDETTGTLSIPDEPDTILSKRLLELIQRMFEEAYIEDATGHCQNRIYWHQYAAELPRLDPVPEWNDPIFWPESVRTVLCSSNRKTPSIDGVPAEWMKLATPKDGTTGTLSIPDEPDTILCKRLLVLIQRMFEEACIPDVRRTAEVVLILRKDSYTQRHEHLPDYSPHPVYHEATFAPSSRTGSRGASRNASSSPQNRLDSGATRSA
jgi:hypothetical protein